MKRFFVTAEAILLALPIWAAAKPVADPSQQAYQDGHVARLQWEAWFNALTGDERVGALFWTGQRSLSHPGSCEQQDQSVDWRAGCSRARGMLAPADVRRRAEPQFWFGWNAPTDVPTNSPQASAPVLAPLADAVPADDDFTAICTQELNQAYRQGTVSSVGVAYQFQAACVERHRQQAIQAQEEAEEARRRAQAAREAAAQQAEEARIAAEKAAQQEAAEQSPDNNCHKPTFAGGLINAFNDFDRMKELGIKAIDIEHLITTKWDTGTMDVICHGTFVLTNGLKLTGSLEMRPNVAGDMISQWRPDRP